MRLTTRARALAIMLFPLAAMLVAAPSAAATGTSVTRGVVGYGTVHVEGNGSPGDCTSVASTPGGTAGNPNSGTEVDCAAFTGASYDVCTGSGEDSICRLTLRAQVPDAGGWRFDHWSGDCAGSNPTCTLETSETFCDPELKPPCHTSTLGPFTAVAHFVDTRVPTTSFSQAPAANSVVFSDTASQSFHWFSNEDQEATTFLCSRDGDAFTGCGSGLTWSGLDDGVHDLCVHATDASGLQGFEACSPWEQERNPTATILTHPAATTTEADAHFTYRSNKSEHPADGSTVAYLCSLDGLAFTSCPADGESFGAQATGQHTFEVEAVFHAALEAVGATHVSPAASFTWTQAESGGHATPAALGPAVPPSAQVPVPSAPASHPKCRKGYRLRKVRGSLRCVKRMHHQSRSDRSDDALQG